MKTGELDIRAPLLAFGRVCRRTGAIRRTCFFQNSSESKREIRVRYGFQEHSWIRLAPTDTSIEVEPGTLVLAPGQSRIDVVLNTDSSNFPYDRFRGRIYFEDEQASEEKWLEISFEKIDDLDDFVGYTAIDLGTSNSMLALYHLERDALRGEPWSPRLDREHIEIPSAIFIKDLARFRKLAEGSASVGRDALADYQLDDRFDPRSLQLGIKRLIGGPAVLAADQLGAGGAVEPTDVLYMLARAIRERTQQNDDVRARLRRLTVTFPPTWDHRQLYHWKSIFRKLGYQEEDLDLSLDEASAAGLFHVYRWISTEDSRKRLLQDLSHSVERIRESGRDGEKYTLHLLSFDFGGGTTDLAFIQVDLIFFGDTTRLKISLLGSDSIEFGGDEVTLAVFRILKRRLALALTDYDRLHGKTESDSEESPVSFDSGGLFMLPGESTFFSPVRQEDKEQAARRLLSDCWEEIEREIGAERLRAELEDAIDVLVPTRFWTSPEEPLSPSAKKMFTWLWDQAEALKCELFRKASREAEEVRFSELSERGLTGGLLMSQLPPELAERGKIPSAPDARVPVSVGEIYDWVETYLEEAVTRAKRLIADHRVDRIVLSGQSSWIPLVKHLFMRPKSEGGLGLPPNKIDFDPQNAKAAVCKGACLLPILREALVGYEVDVSNFKANLLSEVYFFQNGRSGKKTLFEAGPIDELNSIELQPDPASFARHLSIFTGHPAQLLGQFDFNSAGDALADSSEFERQSCQALGLDAFPASDGLEAIKERDPSLSIAIHNELREWSETAVISWLERGLENGSPEVPTYRFYLTRNRTLCAVCDHGGGAKRLYRLSGVPAAPVLGADAHPFSGVH